jgi:transposase
MNGLEPQAYIADVIVRTAAEWPAARWDELLLWNWQSPNDQLLAEAA